jgi:hypothetical protein
MSVPNKPNHRRPSALEAQLQRLGSVAYAVDARGIIVAYAQTAWNQAAMANGAPELTRPERCLWDLIGHRETLLAYQGFHRLIVSGARPRFTTLHTLDEDNPVRRQLRACGDPCGHTHQPAVKRPAV